MKKPVGRLLYPNTGWYFAAMLLFTAAAAAVGQYILAGGALFVTPIMFIISRARLSRRKRPPRSGSISLRAARCSSRSSCLSSAAQGFPGASGS